MRIHDISKNPQSNVYNERNQMRTSIQVLSIGEAEPILFTYNHFLERHQCRIISVTNHRELHRTSPEEEVEIAVLHHTLTKENLRRAGEYVRRRWPRARILIISTEAPALEDTLYDDRVPTGLNPELLLAAIYRLSGKRIEGNTGCIAG